MYILNDIQKYKKCIKEINIFYICRNSIYISLKIFYSILR